MGSGHGSGQSLLLESQGFLCQSKRLGILAPPPGEIALTIPQVSPRMSVRASCACGFLQDLCASPIPLLCQIHLPAAVIGKADFTTQQTADRSGLALGFRRGGGLIPGGQGVFIPLLGVCIVALIASTLSQAL